MDGADMICSPTLSLERDWAMRVGTLELVHLQACKASDTRHVWLNKKKVLCHFLRAAA
jgi:hypothetical protein